MRADEIAVALVFAVLLVLEWRSRRGIVRVGTVMLVAVVLFFAHPVPHRAARRAFGAPIAERITQWRPGGPRISDYLSGVLTMEEFVSQDSRMDSNSRMMAMGVLFWLACSPALRGIGPHWRRAFPRRTAGDGEVEG